MQILQPELRVWNDRYFLHILSRWRDFRQISIVGAQRLKNLGHIEVRGRPGFLGSDTGAVSDLIRAVDTTSMLNRILVFGFWFVFHHTVSDSITSEIVDPD